MLFNFHIPKTGGTAMATLLQASHGAQHVQLYYQPPFPFLPYAECKKLRSFYGNAKSLSSHNVRRFDAENFWPGAQFLVVLREPVERLCSAFFHLQRLAPHIKYGRPLPASIEDFIRNQTEEHNVMVRFRCGLIPGDEVLPKHLDEALAELEKYDLLGLTEDMPETIRRLKVMVPTVAEHLSRENINPHREADATYRSKLPGAVVRLIEQHNSLDIELYQYAHQLFYR
jgi:hypothetical protein